jgi:hypothetical protein
MRKRQNPLTRLGLRPNLTLDAVCLLNRSTRATRWTKTTTWDTSSTDILFRPGLLDFKNVARRVGRMGTFYSSLAPIDSKKMNGFLENCAAEGYREKPWSKIGGSPLDPTECGEMFYSMLASFRSQLIPNEQKFKSRINDQIGANFPALISTAVITGDATKAFNKAKKAYLSGVKPEFSASFEDIKFGYFGSSKDLDRVAKEAKLSDDYKSTKFLTLGAATWAEALRLSPAEPGLANGQSINQELISVGGWSDLFPVLPLKSIGCDSVTYVTRQGGQPKFATGVAKLLGMSDGDTTKMFSMQTKASKELSSYERAVDISDAIWCTDWDKSINTQIEKTFISAFNSKLELRKAKPFYVKPIVNYPKIAKDFSLKGCSRK